MSVQADHSQIKILLLNNELTPDTKVFLNETRNKLKGHERRRFMAQVVALLGRGGQLRAERELGWDRKTIIKGTKELRSNIQCFDNFAGRGRYRIEVHLPNLLDDIKSITEPICQTDPTFRTTNTYAPITAEEVRRRLITEKNYSDEELPTSRTILNKLNELGHKPKKVAKCMPKKK